MRTAVAAALAVLAALSVGCARDAAPSSLFDDAGYHVRGSAVHYLNPFPGSAIDGASPRGFRVLDGGYSTDGVATFSFDRMIPGADARSLRTLGGPYAVDAHRVYWMGRLVEGADPGSFTVLDANFECSADQTALLGDVDLVRPLSYTFVRSVCISMTS